MYKGSIFLLPLLFLAILYQLYICIITINIMPIGTKNIHFKIIYFDINKIKAFFL